MPGIDASRALRAILSVLPLDTFTEPAAAGWPSWTTRMVRPVREFQAVVDAAAGRLVRIESIKRFAFYERARAAYAVVATGEPRFYGNIIVVKEGIPPA